MVDFVTALDEALQTSDYPTRVEGAQIVADAEAARDAALVVANRPVAIESLYALRSAEQRADLRYMVRSYYGNEEDGYASEWRWDADRPRTDHDGRRVISPTVPWTGAQTTQAAWMAGTGETEPAGVGCFVRTGLSTFHVPQLAGMTELVSFEPKRLIVFAGVDSLTDGAGGNGGTLTDSYFNILSNSLRAHFGDGGPGWTGIDNRVASRELMNFSRSTDLAYIKGLDRSTDAAKYSLDFTGLHSDAATTSSTCLLGFVGVGKANRNWDRAKLYYLQQPGGCSFNVFQTGAGNVPIAVNSDGPLELRSVEIVRSPSLANQIQINVTAPGKCTLYGYWWTLDKPGGVICSRLALGGYQTAWWAALDGTFQQQWLSELAPTHYLFNGGRNDISVPFTAEAFRDNAALYMSRFPASCQKLVISPNESSTDNTTGTLIRRYRTLMSKWAAENGHGYIDNAEVLGNYQEAVNRGWMLDTTHPSGAGNCVIAANILRYMGVPLYPWTQPDPYVGADATPVLRGSLASRGYNGIAPGASQKILEFKIASGAWLFEVRATIRNGNGTGQVSSTHRLRLTAPTTIGTLAGAEEYRDGMTETYTLSVSQNESGNYEVYVNAGAGNSNPINAALHGDYYFAGNNLVGGQLWTQIG